MNTREQLMVVVGAVTVALGAAALSAAGQERERRYHVHTLDSLGGTSSRGNGVNDWGLVSGYSNREGNQIRRATAWLLGRAFDLGTLGGTHSSVPWPRQNDRGLVVGIAQTAKPQTRLDGWSCRGFFPETDATKFMCRGVAWEWGRMMTMPTLGGDNSFATSANNQRQVVGWAEGSQVDPSCDKTGDREFKAVLWDLNSGRLIALPPFDTDSASAATALSEQGHVVGISGDCDQSIGRRSAKHAVLWRGQSVKDLGTVADETWNTPTAITPRGDIVVGFVNAIGASPDDPRFRAWLWTERDDIACPKLPGTSMCDLGTLEAGGTAQAWGVNAKGQVVGTSCPPSGFCKAFLWENGTMTDLNLIKGGYQLNLENAMDISDSGFITGRARTPENGFVAYLAVPRRK